MTQPTEAVGGEPIVESQLTPEDRLTAAFDDPANHQEDEPAEGEDELPAEEAEDEPTDEAEADDLPPIDAPVSWDAEAKERFAKLPREDQEYLSKREGERERFRSIEIPGGGSSQARCGTGCNPAARPNRAGLRGPLPAASGALQPQRPNPALLQHDPVAFYAQQAQYEGVIAQQRELQQTAQQYAQQAQQRAAMVEQAEFAKQRNIIVEHFPAHIRPTRRSVAGRI
jgi:hypothetical protein